MTEKLTKIITDAALAAGLTPKEIHLEHPDDISHGDYSTNIALALAKEAKENPRALAEKIVEEIRKNLSSDILKVEVAGAGFINFYLSKEFFAKEISEIVSKKENYVKGNALKGKEALFEYTDPNPFKPFHIGHLMSNSIGEALSRLAENQGAQVKRMTYGGDVGLHVAKEIYGMTKLKEGFPENGDSLTDKTKFLGDAYVLGNRAYEEDPNAANEIKELNKKIFEMVEAGSADDDDLRVYWEKGKTWSVEHFEEIYKKLGSHFNNYIFESEVSDEGKKIVKENIGKVFEESEGAIIFKGEDHGLHTRVFLTSEGLPPYEAKELGLFEKKNELYPKHDVSVVVTASEQNDYFRVITRVVSLLFPKQAEKLKHISHGMMRFAEGKMSSRKGNVITGESLLSETEVDAAAKIAERELTDVEKKEITSAVAVAAIKYSILRQSPGKDIIFDPEKSLSFEGDSGPYLQYALVRAYSLLSKGKEIHIGMDAPKEWQTTYIEKMLSRAHEIFLRAWTELSPQILAGYLMDLSGAFNTFYGEGKIVDENDTVTSGYKLAITEAFSAVLAAGLSTLGITPLRKM